jgi:hypothetical protein
MTYGRRDVPSFPPMRGAVRIAAVLLCGLAAAAADAAPPISRQAYSISEFDTVRLEAPLDVVVTTDKGVAASATGDRDTLDRIDLRVNSGILVIRLRTNGSFGGSGDGRARAATKLSISTNLLQRVTVMGAGTLSVDRLKGAQVQAMLSGGGRLTVARVEADKADVALGGSGSMTLLGSVPDAKVTMSGSGRLDGTGFVAQRLVVVTEGSADAQLAARDTATVSANGTGQVTVVGKANCTVRKVGSASITCAGAVY